MWITILEKEGILSEKVSTMNRDEQNHLFYRREERLNEDVLKKVFKTKLETIHS